MGYKIVSKTGIESNLMPELIISVIENAAEYHKSLNADVDRLLGSVINTLPDVITEFELVNLIADCCVQMVMVDPTYSNVGASVLIDYRKKCIEQNGINSFSDSVRALHVGGFISDVSFINMLHNKSALNGAIDSSRDHFFDYFGFKTLQKGYMVNIDNGGEFEQSFIETPQYMWMRLAIQVADDDVESMIETYNMLSTGVYIHGTPTIMNSCSVNPQLSSCYLQTIQSDSIEGIFKTIADSAVISKFGGGIGLNMTQLRGRGSYIKGSNSIAEGVVPMLKVFDETTKYVNQGGKRKGSMAVYIEPWHSDIEEFIDLKKTHGKEEARAKDLFYAMWIPDLFMERVKEDGDWSLFSPDEVPSLLNVHGKEFNNNYKIAEKAGLARKTMKARELWQKILISQIETGNPYIHYKDAHNEKSNQKNLGTINGSNLCSEISQFTSDEETAVCNLASICLPKFVKNGIFMIDDLVETARLVTRNLNNVIDRSFYPVDEARLSNLNHRAIGIGVQGLANVFAMLGYSFDSPQAKNLNKTIFEAIYYGACLESNSMAIKSGKPYNSFYGSPASHGKLQFDLWGVEPNEYLFDWNLLKDSIKKFGMVNSLLAAPMPTASTATIWNNNEAFEPFTNNIYVRRTLTGEYLVINRHLVADLQEINLWNQTTRDAIILNSGSLESLEFIPERIRKIHKTVWNISQQVIIDMAADRGAFVDQSQSMNLFLAEPTVAKLNSMHFYSWKAGLKTGMYYLRLKPAMNAKKFAVIESDSCEMCSA